VPVATISFLFVALIILVLVDSPIKAHDFFAISFSLLFPRNSSKFVSKTSKFLEINILTGLKNGVDLWHGLVAFPRFEHPISLLQSLSEIGPHLYGNVTAENRGRQILRRHNGDTNVQKARPGNSNLKRSELGNRKLESDRDGGAKPVNSFVKCDSAVPAN
jgi:hypothetical protein